MIDKISSVFFLTLFVVEILVFVYFEIKNKKSGSKEREDG